MQYIVRPTLIFFFVLSQLMLIGQDKPLGTVKIQKIMIVVLVKNMENRITLEDELKYAFSDYGILAVPSHTTRLKDPSKLKSEHILPACKKHGVDGVLVVDIEQEERTNTYSYNQPTQYYSGGNPSANSSGFVISKGKTHSWGQYAFGNYFDVVNSPRAFIYTDVLKVNDDYSGSRIIYKGETIMRVGDMEKAIGAFSKKLTKQLVRRDFLVADKS